MNSNPAADQQVIVKIDASKDNSSSTRDHYNGNKTTLYKEKEVATEDSMEDHARPCSEPVLMAPLDIEMGEEPHNVHDIRGEGSGSGPRLPPLYPADGGPRHSDVSSSAYVNNGGRLRSPTTESNSTNNDGRFSLDNDDDNDDDDYDDGGDVFSIAGENRRKNKPSKENNNMMNNHFYGLNDDHNDVMRCKSLNSSPRKLTTTASIAKTRSRLMDPPSPLDQRAMPGLLRSGQLNNNDNNNNNSNNNISGGLKSCPEEEEEDQLLEDDLPEEFKKPNCISTLIVLEWACLVALTGSLICSLSIPVLRKTSIWELKLWKWEVFGLSLISGRLFSGWLIKIIVFFIERNFMLRKRILYFIYGLKQAVQIVTWSALVLFTWHFIFNSKIQSEADRRQLELITTILVVGDIAALLWLLKTLVVKVCASTFHVKAFFDRIQESLYNQFLIETLSAPPLYELNVRDAEQRMMAEVQLLQNAGMNLPPDLRATVLLANQNGNKNVAHVLTPPSRSPRHSLKLSRPSSRKYHDEGITLDHLHKMNQRNVSAWNMKRLIKIVRHGLLTTLDEHIENSAATHVDEHSREIHSEVEAKAAARKIFRNVAKPRVKFIYLNDLLRFMPEDEAIKTMGLFEGASEAGRISKASLKNWVVHAFRERRALAFTLGDTKTAVNKLHQMVNVIVIILMILIALVWFDFITSESIVFLSSQLVVAAFVFGNTCKNVFESIIFLFVIHPFDVGDRCEVGGVQMIVEEMNILTTIFLRYDCQKIIYPNYVLLSLPIHNFYRSPDMGDAVEFCLHISITPEKLAQVKQRIWSYIVSKKEHWHPNPMVVLKDAESLYMLRIAVWVTHRMNFQNMGERWDRRALLVEECIKIFKELDVDYRNLAMNSKDNSIAAMLPGVTWSADPYTVAGPKEVSLR